LGIMINNFAEDVWPKFIDRDRSNLGMPVAYEPAAYPNPARNVVALPVSIEKQAQVRLTVCNVFGGKVHEETRFCGTGRNEFHVSTAGFRPGIYLYRFEAAGNISHGRFSVVR
jgi:hypothetical protein